MASENTIYGNSYKLNISDDFRRGFNLLPINSSPGEYTYAVYAKERHSWLSDDFLWGSKLIDCNGKIVNAKETTLKYDYEVRKCAFVAELINYGCRFNLWDTENFFSFRHSLGSFKLSNYNLDESLFDSNFKIEVGFYHQTFDWCLDTFKSLGIDTEKYNFYICYKWEITKSYAKLLYNTQCIYNHQDPKYVLAHLGWYVRSEAD